MKFKKRHPIIARLFRRGRPVRVPLNDPVHKNSSRRSNSTEKELKPALEKHTMHIKRSRSFQYRKRRSIDEIRSNVEELFMSHRHHFLMRAMIKENLIMRDFQEADDKEG